MKICPKCDGEHEKTGIYCSRKCANSRVFSEQSKQRKSIASKRYWLALSEEEKQRKGELLHQVSPYCTVNYLQSLLTQDWNVIGIQGKRLRVILEQNGKCNKCELDEWLGERITLEYEHKDGNNDNNARENVEALCPNCHSQTTTWRGRKNKKSQLRVEKYIDLNQ